MKKKYTLGRSVDSDFVLTDEAGKISRTHAEITYFKSDYVYLKDLGSTNGTFVKGVQLIPQKLYKVDKTADVRLGPSYKLDILALFSQANMEEEQSAELPENTEATTEEFIGQPAVEDVFVVGRSNDADIIIIDPDRRISRNHLMITKFANEQFFIRDLNSGNGTTLNSSPIPPEVDVLVQKDDIILLGKDYPFDLGSYFDEARGPWTNMHAENNDEITIVVAKEKKITLSPTKITLGELADLSDEQFLTVGRGEDNDIIIDQQKISRQHLKIRQLSPFIFEMIDLGSTNKTFLDGQQIPPNQSIKFQSDANINLGGAYTLDLYKHFDGIKVPAQPTQVNNFLKVMYQKPQMADAGLMAAFNELEHYWEEYRASKKDIATAQNKQLNVNSTSELFLKGLEVAGALTPGFGIIMLAGGWILNKWLGIRKKKQLEDKLNYEDLFLDMYCCPNCQAPFGVVPWNSIKICRNCNVIYRT